MRCNTIVFYHSYKLYVKFITLIDNTLCSKKVGLDSRYPTYGGNSVNFNTFSKICHWQTRQ